MLTGLDKARRTLERLPDATENIAALAKAWADGDVDLSKGAPNPQPPIKRNLWKPIAYIGTGAVVALGGVWAAAQF